MQSHPNQLPIPNSAADNDQAIEILRVWAANGQQHVSVATGLWEDPASWGIMVVDLIKLIGDAYEQTTGDDASIIVSRIRSGFEAEWETATDKPSGEVI